MSDTNRAKAGGFSFAPILLAIVGLAIVGGFAYWVKNLQTEPPPQAPIASRVQGSSFEVPVPSAVKSEPKEISAPAPAPKVETPVAPPAETKTVAAPVPIPVVTELKPAEKPVAPPPIETPPAVKAPEAKPVEVKPAVPKTVETKPSEVKPAEEKPADAKAAEVKPAPADDKPVSITFAKLAFRYWPQPKNTKDAKDPFPAQIRAMNGQKITIDGYMFPIDFEKGKVRSFLLSRGMFGCCYGDTPQISEVIKVTRTDGKLMPFEAMARVTGILEVGEEFDGEGYVDSVYRIKAEVVGPAPASR